MSDSKKKAGGKAPAGKKQEAPKKVEGGGGEGRVQSTPAKAGKAAASPAEKPEVQAAAAFAGGLVLALILKRLGR